MKYYLSFLLVLVCTISKGQNINDALRLGLEDPQGTARFQAMGGAFGALGGDLSALNINPAGSAVFNNGLFSITGGIGERENTAFYFGEGRISEERTADLNQLGAVFVFNNNDESNWKKLALAINYNIQQDYDDFIVADGRGTQGIDNYFLNFAQGVPFGSILLQDDEFLEEAYLDIGAVQGYGDQQAFLGYYGGIIDPVDGANDDNTAYVSNTIYTDGGGVDQSFVQNTSGYNSKFTLNIGSQYQDHLYLGASVNIHNVVYDRLMEYTESGHDADSEIQTVTFDNLLHTEGSGFSFNLGAIAKLNQNIRIGGSYQSPTWYRLTDDFSQRIFSDLADEDINFINFNVVNLFEAYTIKTPGKLTGSLALVFGTDGLLSFDYGYQDMGQAELRPTNDPSFALVNDQIANELGAVSSFRIGGEYRIDRFSLRGGYRYEQSPYVDDNAIGDLNGFSAGLGYNFGPSRLDLAFSRSERERNQSFFDTGLTNAASINTIRTQLLLGYSLNF